MNFNNNNIKNNIKRKIILLAWNLKIYYMYNLELYYDNDIIKTRFYTCDNNMILTLNKIIRNYSSYYLKNTNVYGIKTINRENNPNFKLCFPFLIDSKRIIILNNLRYNIKYVEYEKNNLKDLIEI